MAERPIHVTSTGSDTDGLREFPDGSNSGLLIPTHTTAQRNSSPSTGEIAYNSTLAALEFYNGSAWVDLNVESIQDIVGAMFTSNTETNITVTYEDGDGTIDLVALAGDITSVVAGTGLSGGGTSGDVTINVDASQAITALTGGDLTLFDDANNADVSLALGTSATESLTIQVLNGGSNKTAEEIHFSTATASATANHGKMVFDIDGSDILTIDDGGIDIASGKTIAINGSDIAITDTQLTTEEVQDIVGTMFTSNTETNITATYQDGDGTVDLVALAGDITSVVAGVGLSGGGTTGDVTLTLDLSELSAVTPIDGDSFATLDSDGAAEQRTTTTALATLFAGTGITASSSVIGVDASQAITALTGGDLTIFDDANNADVSLKLGTSATEALSIEVLNGGSNKTAEEVKIKTSTASGTANHGKISVYIDDTEILDIDDGGIDLAAGMTFAIDGTDIVSMTEEAVEDFVGGMLGGTETFISVTYQDSTNDIDFVVPVNDEDDMSSDSAAHLATQQSIKAYVDSKSPIGKQSMWIPSTGMYPTATNGCADLASLDSGGNTGPDLKTLDFDDAADEFAQFSVAMPSYWNEGTLTFKVYWTSEATDTDGCAWGLNAVALADSDSINTAFGTAIVVTDDAISAAKDLYITAESGDVTVAGSPAAGELCYFNIFRDVSDSNDDMAEDAKLIGVKIFYTVDDVHEA